MQLLRIVFLFVSFESIFVQAPNGDCVPLFEDFKLNKKVDGSPLRAVTFKIDNDAVVRLSLDKKYKHHFSRVAHPHAHVFSCVLGT